jgi:hypothetical protein
MGKKKHLKVLKQIAQELPEVTTNTIEYHEVLGAVLLAQGQTHEDDGTTPINPLKVYTQAMPVVLAVNHKRRMRNMFINHGAAGVNSYIKAVKQKAAV